MTSSGTRHPYGQLARQDEMLGSVHKAGPRRVVEPVDPEEIERVRIVGADARQLLSDRARDECGYRELRKGRERDL